MKKGGNKTPIVIKHEGADEGTCSGTLALTLRVSRLVGLAPLHMKRERSRWRISLSKAFAWYSYVLKVTLDVVLTIGLIMDFCIDESRAIVPSSTTSRVFWWFEVEFIMMMTNYGVFTAPKRMKTIFESLNMLDSIHETVGDYKKRPRKKQKKVATLVSLLIYALVINLGGFISFVVDAINYDKEVTVAFLYICYFIITFQTIVMSIQSTVVRILVETALKSINLEIERTIKSYDLQGTAEKPYSLLSGRHFPTAIPVPKLQPLVNIMLVQNSKLQSPREIESRLRSLSYAYAVACKMLKQLDDCFGVTLVLTLAYIFFKLIMAPYYLAGLASSKNPDKSRVAFEMAHTIFHLINLVLLTEPGSRIKKQMVRTEMLLSQLLRRITPEDHRFEDLEYFYQQVMMYQPEFTALGFGSMRRPLIIAVIAGVSNYLTMVVQLEVSEKNKW